MIFSTKVFAVYGATALTMLLLDVVWLGLVAKPLYMQGIGHLMTAQPRWAVALLFYTLYSVGLMIFCVLPQAALPGPWKAALYGALFGLCAYGTYDLTNLITLRGWPVGLSILDMAWGAFISAVSAAAGKVVLDRFPPG